MSFELTMTIRYARDWSKKAGVRELVQNMLDGHDQGYKMGVSFIKVNGKSYIAFKNEGLVLDKSVWLLGESNKGSDARGRHGDGLKVGSLVLVREGVDVFFLSGNERWTPTLVSSETFSGKTVLKIVTRAGSARENDYTACVAMTPDEWEGYRQDFLPLSDLDPTTIRKGGYAGNLLLDPRAKGRVFVKGIWVCDKPNLDHGYDLHDVSLDRDRRIMDTWDIQYQAGKILSHVAQEDAAMLAQIFQDLVADKADVEHIHYHDGEIKDALAAQFHATYGDKAVAVENAAEATKVEHYGLKGVVVPKGLREVVVGVDGTVEHVIKKAMDTCGAYLTDEDLDPAERKVWRLAKGILTLTGLTVDPATTRVYDFRVPNAPLGTFNHGTGEIRINRQILKDGPQAVVTLAHEIAHRDGRDGTLDHRSAEERILKDVIGTLISLVDTNWIAE
jgi:hypothetical protein